MAIDYGSKRTGLAVTDPERIIATALDTVASHQLLDYLTAYVRTEPIDLFVIGQPRRMHNELSEVEARILTFIKKLKQQFPDVSIARFDERFTSKMASQAILEAGMKKKDRQDKALVDKVSAVIILQSYMEFIQHNTSQ
jgi:putative Holliday junction resolvase